MTLTLCTRQSEIDIRKKVLNEPPSLIPSTPTRPACSSLPLPNLPPAQRQAKDLPRESNSSFWALLAFKWTSSVFLFLGSYQGGVWVNLPGAGILLSTEHVWSMISIFPLWLWAACLLLVTNWQEFQSTSGERGGSYSYLGGQEVENLWQVSSRPRRSVLLAYQKLTLLGIALGTNWPRGHSSAVSQEGVFPGYRGFRGRKAPTHKGLDE